MKCAEKGDKIAIHYVGTLDNGAIFDSYDDSPMVLILGNDEIFSALEDKIIGMKVNDVKNILIKSADAYGERRDENIIVTNKSLFPAKGKLEVGQRLELEFSDGDSRIMLVIKVEGDAVTLDGNHALSGHDLTFALKLSAILD